MNRDGLSPVRAADHRGAAADFRASSRKCSSHPACGSHVVQDTSECTNWMGGVWPKDHHSNLPHKGEEN